MRAVASRCAFPRASNIRSILHPCFPIAQIADLTISLEGSGPDSDLGAPAMVVAHRVLSAINQRVKDDAGGRGLGHELRWTLLA